MTRLNVPLALVLERLRQVLVGYDPTPEEEAEADAEAVRVLTEAAAGDAPAAPIGARDSDQGAAPHTRRV